MSERHGMYGTPTYKSWHSMIQRCTNQHNPRYKDYGGKGIKVCEGWLKSFVNFYKDMGVRPDNKTLDRMDNGGDYNTNNCEWRTPKEQSNNTSFNHLVTFNGKTFSLSQWEDVTGIDQRTLNARIVRLGWSIEKALTKKPRKKVNYGKM